MTPADLIAAVRAAQGIPSNYRLARVLDVPEKTVQRWNVGANAPDDAMAERLAHLAGFDADMVLAAMQAHRASSEADRARWQRIADRLAHAPALALAALVVGFGVASPDASAMPRDLAADGGQRTSLYIMSNALRGLVSHLTRRARALASSLAGPLPIPAAC